MESACRPPFIRKSATLKLFAVGTLALMFLLPLSMVRETIRERAFYREAAVEGISQSWARGQTLMGPVLVIPYTEAVDVKSYDQEQMRHVVRKEKRERFRYVFPDTQQIEASVALEERYRGIYKVPVYRASVDIRGAFDAVDDAFFREEGREAGKPFLFLNISDIRGIAGDLKVLVDGVPREVRPGTGVPVVSDGIHFPVSILEEGSQLKSYDISLSLKGTKTLQFVPTGRSSRVSMESEWLHPSFTGRYLPSERTVGEDGFSAVWETSFLSTNTERLFKDCVERNQCSPFQAGGFGTTFFQPVDVYQKVQRSVKYGLMFIVLTFSVFFVFEILKKLQVHPVQYIFVGSAQAVFYLLLVSLSEHIPFVWSYLVSAAAVAGLLGYYVSHVLRSVYWGGVFGGMMAVLYLVLFFILLSEDYALLMGSGLLFLVLALLMVATRKVNWYTIGQKDVGTGEMAS